MPFTQNDSNTKDPVSSPLLSTHSVDEAMEQIDRILHQMLLLAELSASDRAVDRDTLQKALEHLQSRIDRIADQL